MRDPPARLAVTAVGDVEPWVLDEAADAVRDQLALTVVDRRRIAPSTVPRTAASDEGDEFDAVPLAHAGFECSNAPLSLTITDRELDLDGDSVFGVAEFEGRAAAVSTVPLAAGVRSDGPDTRFANRVRKQAVCHTGRLVGIDDCDDETCVFAQSHTINDLDDGECDPCEDCRLELAGTNLTPEGGGANGDAEGFDRASDAARSGAVADAGRDQTARSTGTNSPDAEGDVPRRVSAVTHDVANTGRFVGLLVGVAVSFVLAVQVTTPVVDTLAGSWSGLSGPVFWVLLVVTVGVTYLIYRLLSWLVGTTRARLVAAVRSRAQEYLRKPR